MKDDERLELASEFAETGLGFTLQAAGLTIPGVGLAVKAVQLAHKTRVARECRDYLTALAVHLGADDADAVAKLIASKIDDTSVQDAVDGGFRKLMAAVSDRGRRCISALVAEYFIEGRRRDRRFQMVGDLLSAVDDDDFPLLNAIASGAVYVSDALGLRYIFVNEQKKSFWLVGVGTAPNTSLASPVYSLPGRFYAVVDLLARSGFARGWGRLDYQYISGHSVLQFDRHDDPPFVLLRKCLAPVCQQPAIPPPSWGNLGTEHETLPISLDP